MVKKTKNILAVAGVISSVLGILVAIPTLLQANYVAATIAGILVVGGLVILAIAFGDWYAWKITWKDKEKLIRLTVQ